MQPCVCFSVYTAGHVVPVRGLRFRAGMQTSGCEWSAVVTWISPSLDSLNLCLEKNHPPLLCLAAVHRTMPREKQRGIYHSW